MNAHITFEAPPFKSKGRFITVSNLFVIEELPILYEPDHYLEGGVTLINSTWSVRATTNGDGTVKLKTYSRDLKPTGETIGVIEDDDRNITHITIPIWAVIEDTEAANEYKTVSETIELLPLGHNPSCR